MRSEEGARNTMDGGNSASRLGMPFPPETNLRLDWRRGKK
jgi:hypothetical protein